MATRMTDEELNSLEGELSSDNEGAATPLAAEARRARASEARLLEELQRCSLLIDPDRASERYDLIAEEFYRETLLMAPGKSVPLAMQYSQNDDDRREKLWRPFVNRWWEKAAAKLNAAIREAEGE